ncbi:MAG: fumarate hydratase C-terminal domain-containing protein [Acholeplasmatales bacterium]|nr:fumarate hydratase C-terminal domain-containing protein [Acholeplasmatales bacterium]
MIIRYPMDKHLLNSIKAGDVIEFTGTIYTARDAAHMRIKEYLDKGLEIPVDFNDSFIYYAGPTPTKPGNVIGSIGPTTSSRMDKFADMMTTLRVTATIGKGPRDKECSDYYINNKILYFITTGGCGALLAKSVKEAKEIAFLDLGPESIKELYVEGFKMICAIDYFGNNIFKGE